MGPAELDLPDAEPLEIAGPAGRLRGWIRRDDDPDAVPILFVHPINTRGAIWGDVVSRLDAPATCLMPDLRGHGRSDAGGPFGVEHWAADCVAVLDALGVERAHVVGGSLGGPIGCVLAAEHPQRIASLTAIGSALSFAGDLDEPIAALRELGVEGMFRKYFPILTFGPDCDPRVIERGLRLANPNDAETVAAIWSATIATVVDAVAARVDCPALVLTGEHDATCPPAAGERLAAALTTELTLIPGIGHFPMLEAPDETARTVNHFLRTLA